MLGWSKWLTKLILRRWKMAKVKAPTCPVCGQLVTGDHVPKRLKGKTYHIQCYEQIKEEAYGKDKEENNIYLELQNYICKLFEIDVITPLMENQIQKFAKEGYTPASMLYILQYHYDYCENEVKEEKGLGIIPYVQKEAIEFDMQCKRAEEHMKGIKKPKEALTIKNKTIRIKTEEQQVDLIEIKD